MRRLLELAAALVMKRILGPARTPAAPPVLPTAAPSGAASAERRPLALVALTALAVGFVLLVVFDAWLTRLIGVLALFTFIVAGVFAIATPQLLDGEDEGSP